MKNTELQINQSTFAVINYFIKLIVIALFVGSYCVMAGYIAYSEFIKKDLNHSQPAEASISQDESAAMANDVNALSKLIILNGLFANGKNSAADLAALIAVDRITSPDGLSSGQDLANLFLLNSLFGTGNARDLAALIAVNNITGQNNYPGINSR